MHLSSTDSSHSGLSEKSYVDHCTSVTRTYIFQVNFLITDSFSISPTPKLHSSMFQWESLSTLFVPLVFLLLAGVIGKDLTDSTELENLETLQCRFLLEVMMICKILKGVLLFVVTLQLVPENWLLRWFFKPASIYFFLSIFVFHFEWPHNMKV